MVPRMDSLATLVLALSLRFAPPGRSPHSVIPMPECGTDPLGSACEGIPLCPDPVMQCRAPTWSRQRGAWVRIEPDVLAAQRYSQISEQLASTARRLQACSGAESDCPPLGWTGSDRELVLSALTVALHESSLRRDVQYGEGPLGRGPHGEACLLQLDVRQAPRFATWISGEERQRISDSPEAREQFAQSLLGGEPAALSRCFEIGMRMLALARRGCSASPVPADHGMFSLYGSGSTCNAPTLANRARTLARLRAASPELRPQDRALLGGSAPAGEPDTTPATASSS
jgi:hypothetical protein